MFNHLKEVRDAINGLTNQIMKLEKLIANKNTSESVLNAALEFRSALQKQKDAIVDILNRATKKAAGGG